MQKIPLLFCLVLFFAGFASAQEEKNQACPKLDVSLSEIIKDGEPYIFTARVEGYDVSKLSFDWTVSTGEIIEGQGTASIKVLKKDANELLTTTVSIKGLPEGCPVSVSETERIICIEPVARLFDEFGAAANGELKFRMDAFLVELGNQPNAQGYIINYGTDKEISRREVQLRNFIAFKKYDTSRVTFVRGGANPLGKSGVWTKLWTVPPGAVTPAP